MKKTLLLLTSAALLLVGCAKEQIVDLQEGGLTNVTFTANLDNGVATKAVADGDGKGTNVNRCIMEIYFQNQLYTRLVQPVTSATGEAKAYATFANVPVVAGKQYQVLFWADCGGAEKSDLYYTTTSLKAVTVTKTAFIGALVAGDNDKLDAFFFADNYTVSQNQTQPFAVTLKRPFAQLNIITTDVGVGKTVFKKELLPEKVSVSYKADNTINVATGEISRSGQETDYTFTYEAEVYGAWSTVTTNHKELTLSMDYLLASTDKSAIDVTFKTINGSTEVMSHNLTNLPYQRNYRTNVKGELLTVGGTWKAEIDTTWSSPDIVKVVEVADIKSANEIIEQYAETTDNLEVKFVGVPNDSGVPSGSEGSQFRAIRTTPLQEGANLGIEVMTSTNTLYVGDYIYEYKVTGGTVDDYIDNQANQATVNINVPQNSGIGTLIINAPSKTVLVNGKLVSNVGTITNIDAITSQNTLIIEPGQNVTKLTMRQGGLEIHGTVGQAVVPEGHGTIVVRDCENLKETEVYDVLKEYIAEGYVGVKGRTTADLWDIVPIVCKIGNTPYGSLADAFKAVPTDAAAAATVITVVADANETFKTRGAGLKKDQKVILDLNGHKLVGTSMESGYTQYIYVENGGELTVKDSRTGGVIEYHDGYIENLTSGSGTGGSAITCHGCMTLESGTIENKTPDTKTNDLEGAIDMYTNAWGQAYSPADIVLNINGGVVKSNNANTVRLTSFSAQSYTTSVTVNMNGGEVYGRDGFFIQGVSESYLNTNTLNLNGGKVCGTQAVRVMASQSHANTSESKPVTIRIREGVDIQNNYFAQSEKGYWSEGICIDNLSGTFEQLLSYVNIITPVCKIDNSYFFSLSEAVAAAPESSETTIKMVNDVDYGDIAGDGAVVIPSGKVIILDLNGKKISAFRTVKTNTSIIANDGKLTIIDNAGTGEIYMNSTVDDSGWSSSVCAITNRATLIVNSGHIHTDGAAGMSYAIDSRQNGYSFDVVATINGGLIEAPNYRAIRLFANGTNGADNLVVSGGEIIGKTAGIWLQDTNVYKNKANVTISGGKITATGDTRHALYIDGNTDTEGLGVTITGGQFKSPAASVFVENCSNISKFISGGIFSDQPDETLVTDKFEVTENTDAATKDRYPWTIVPGSSYVAQIGSELYTSVQEAFKASKDNETIVLLKDTNRGSDQYTSKCGNNITFDLNGHKIESNNGQGVFHFQMSSYKTINFVDTKGNGGLVQLDSNPSSDTYGAICANGANVNIYAGYYETTPAYHGWTQVLYAKDGNITVYDGTFVGDLFTDNQWHHMMPEWAPEANTIEIFGGVFTGKVLDSYAEDGVKSEVVIHGGKFSFNPTDFLAPGATCSGIPDAEGYYVVTSNN